MYLLHRTCEMCRMKFTTERTGTETSVPKLCPDCIVKQKAG